MSILDCYTDFGRKKYIKSKKNGDSYGDEYASRALASIFHYFSYKAGACKGWIQAKPGIPVI